MDVTTTTDGTTTADAHVRSLEVTMMFRRRSLLHALWLAALALVLAACSQPAELERRSLEETPTLTPAASDLDGWSDADDLVLNVYGTGIGAFGEPISDPADDEDVDTLSLPSGALDDAVQVYVQVVLKGGDWGTDVERVAVESGDYSEQLAGGDFVTTEDGFGRFYEFDVDEVGQLDEAFTATVEYDEFEDNLGRSLIVYVFEDAGDELSVGDVTNAYVHGPDADADDAYQRSFTIPGDTGPRDVEVTFVLSDLEDDDRPIRMTAEADGNDEQVERTEPNEGSELHIETLLLEDVPGDVTEIDTEVFSDPTRDGDSVYVNAIDVGVHPAEDGEEPPIGGQGCTPGYWKQEHHFDSWVNHAPADSFEAVFDVDVTLRGRGRTTFDEPTLLQALEANGGGVNALARHAVAALLNAETSDVAFAYTPSEVIDVVHDAIVAGDHEETKDLLEEANEAGCPLD